jgi:predicted RNase H-like HicB family nuclease
MKLAVHIREASHGPVQVYCPDLPGCSASGPTAQVALELLRRRIDAYFADAARRTPPGTRVITIEV